MNEPRIYLSDHYVKKFFPDYYVGLKEETDTEFNEETKTDDVIDTYLVGFMTPFENNKAGEKRRTTVDEWAKGQQVYDYKTKSYKQNKVIVARVIDNKPGQFIVKGLIRRHNRTSNVVWRVSDPHGFDVEITSENMSMIMVGTGVAEGGLILRPCIWMRIGSQNHLIPERSKVWERWVIPALNYSKT